jgi:starch-binding outer membrane protein, SusD/RagB family
MKKINFLKLSLQITCIAAFVGCTDLEELNLDGTDASGPVNAVSLLKTTYNDLRPFQDQGLMFAMDEMSSDALVGPTRGGDWDDVGKWRQFHEHQWTPENVELVNAYSALLSNVNNCNTIIEKGSGLEVVEARFIKAFLNYKVVDLFGQLPYRELNTPKSIDPKVYTRSEATAYIIKELEEILPNLPVRAKGAPEVANQDAARFLLAKLYLNKAVFTASNASGPYVFAPADMTKVVQYVDAMTNTLSPDYWDNFAIDNHKSDELVFVSRNDETGSGNVRSRWHMGNHYYQTPSGWNGFTTLAEYYDRYNPTDKRIFNPKPSVLAINGYNLGFQVGQMKNGADTDANGKTVAGIEAGTLNLNDRNGSPLVFTKSITMRTGGNTLETAGIRGVKYEPDLAKNSNGVGYNDDSVVKNDYVLMRYSDALLMKAEAIVRGGSGSIGTIMSDIAARTGTGDAPSPATLEGIYLERGRELWWEGWRRNDMIRFGKFLQSRELKSGVSNSKYLLYPLPTAALYNPNIKQNPGY